MRTLAHLIRAVAGCLGFAASTVVLALETGADRLDPPEDWRSVEPQALVGGMSGVIDDRSDIAGRRNGGPGE